MPYTQNTLDELAFMYGTDKKEHGYISFYEQYLPKNPKRILEIGVFKGQSIRMWLKYFPDAEIHGLDLFKENDIPFSDERVKWHIGHQCDYFLMEKLRAYDFDVIIEDGSHNSRDQMITFFGLFNGKHYFMEDTHCAKEDFYSQGLPEEFRCNSIFQQIQYPNGFNPHVIIGQNITLIKCS